MQKLGKSQLYGVEGHFVNKSEVQNYINRVKLSNPQGVVLCVDTEEIAREKVKTDGAFNVYFDIGEKVYVDFLGKGFDMGAITKGKENHESWIIDWDELLFVTPNNMNRYREHLISDTDYLNSARRRLQHLLNIGYKPEYIKGKIPRTYKPMPASFKEMLLEDIMMPIYEKRTNLKQNGLNSFGVQGMIIQGELCPIEINRIERFASKNVYDNQEENER